MDRISEERIETLHPVFREKARKFVELLEKSSEYRWRVTSAFRSLDEQKKLHDAYTANPSRAAIASAPGLSFHNYGLAIDVLPMSDDFKRILNITTAEWQPVGIIAKALGLTWGGDFKTRTDRPHVEYHYNGAGIKTLQKWASEGRYIKGTHYLDLPPF